MNLTPQAPSLAAASHGTPASKASSSGWSLYELFLGPTPVHFRCGGVDYEFEPRGSDDARPAQGTLEDVAGVRLSDSVPVAARRAHSDDEAAKQVAGREAAIWALLSPPGISDTGRHANIAAFYGQQLSAEGDVYVVVEQCPGEHLGAHALRAKLAARKRQSLSSPTVQPAVWAGGLPYDEVCTIARDVVGALCLLHGSSPPVVHGSLALEAFRRGDDGRWKLYGFPSTAPPSYRDPPERLVRGPLRQLVAASATRRSDASSMAEDAWSVGVLLHWLVYGEAPDLRSLHVADGEWQPPRAHPLIDDGDGSTTSSLVSTIAACLRRKPERRPTAFELEKLFPPPAAATAAAAAATVAAAPPIAPPEADVAVVLDGDGTKPSSIEPPPPPLPTGVLAPDGETAIPAAAQDVDASAASAAAQDVDASAASAAAQDVDTAAPTSEEDKAPILASQHNAFAVVSALADEALAAARLEDARERDVATPTPDVRGIDLPTPKNTSADSPAPALLALLEANVAAHDAAMPRQPIDPDSVPVASESQDAPPQREVLLALRVRRGPSGGLGLGVDGANVVAGLSETGQAYEDGLIALNDEVLAVDGVGLDGAPISSRFTNGKPAYWLTVRRHGGPLVDSMAMLPVGHFASESTMQVRPWQLRRVTVERDSTRGLGLGLTSANVLHRVVPGGGASRLPEGTWHAGDVIVAVNNEKLGERRLADVLAPGEASYDFTVLRNPDAPVLSAEAGRSVVVGASPKASSSPPPRLATEADVAVPTATTPGNDTEVDMSKAAAMAAEAAAAGAAALAGALSLLGRDVESVDAGQSSEREMEVMEQLTSDGVAPSVQEKGSTAMAASRSEDPADFCRGRSDDYGGDGGNGSKAGVGGAHQQSAPSDADLLAFLLARSGIDRSQLVRDFLARGDCGHGGANDSSDLGAFEHVGCDDGSGGEEDGGYEDAVKEHTALLQRALSRGDDVPDDAAAAEEARIEEVRAHQEQEDLIARVREMLARSPLD